MYIELTTGNLADILLSSNGPMSAFDLCDHFVQAGWVRVFVQTKIREACRNGQIDTGIDLVLTVSETERKRRGAVDTVHKLMELRGVKVVHITKYEAKDGSLHDTFELAEAKNRQDHNRELVVQVKNALPRGLAVSGAYEIFAQGIVDAWDKLKKVMEKDF